MFEFKDVSYSNDGINILKSINFKINKGDFISIVGPSGSGKSTFLKLCNNLISPTSGKITYKDKDILEYNPVDLRKEVAYCFQIPHLFGDSVLDNLKFPFSIRSKELDIDRIKLLFNEFKMNENFINSKIVNLSGGERQRIALIRTLIFQPKVLLLDEVTSSLDAENTLIVESVIEDLSNKGITILWVTHNEQQSLKYSNKRIEIQNGQIDALEVLK